MADIPALLAKIPDDVKPLAALGIGTVVLVFLALFHGIGLHLIRIQNHRGEKRLSLERPHVIAAWFLFAWSVVLMLDLHIVEILGWAFVLNHMGLVVHGYDAIYFCANGYTTLGMGKMDVEEHWRTITPIIAISGLFTFAWTTSALVDVVAADRRLLNQLEEEREQEMRMRFDRRKQEWDVLKAEREAVRAEWAETRANAAGASFFKRIGIWREGRSRVKQIRRANAAEIKTLRQKERLAEEKLGTDASDGGSDKK